MHSPLSILKKFSIKYPLLTTILTTKRCGILIAFLIVMFALLVLKKDNITPLPAQKALGQEQHQKIIPDSVDALHQLTQKASQRLALSLAQPLTLNPTQELDKNSFSLFIPKKDTKIDIANSTVLYEITAKKHILNWLKKHWQVYALDDVGLLSAIKSLCPSANEYHLVNYQQKIKSCLKHPLIANLRDLSQTQKLPFQQPGRQVRISVPALIHQPALGHAYTCFKGDLANQKVALFSHSKNQQTDESIMVNVIGAYSCVDGKKYPDIQLNEQQGRALFKHRISVIENALAFTL